MFGAPKLIRVSGSLIEWEGAELGSGKIPVGARRLNKMGMIARPGQRTVRLHGMLGEDGHTLREGLRLEVEPNVGANDYISDMRVFLECRGAVGVSLGTGFTWGRGSPSCCDLVETRRRTPERSLRRPSNLIRSWLGPCRGL